MLDEVSYTTLVHGITSTGCQGEAASISKGSIIKQGNGPLHVKLSSWEFELEQLPSKELYASNACVNMRWRVSLGLQS